VKGRTVELDECVRLAVESGLRVSVGITETSMTGAEDALKKALQAAGLKVERRENVKSQ
jgi:hypothetical protein